MFFFAFYYAEMRGKEYQQKESRDIKYSSFHKSLPNSGLQLMHWTSVRFNEMGVITKKKFAF